MSRSIHRLSARRVETEKAVGKHSDGGNLWLLITKDGSKRWVFAYERNKKRHEMGLGSASDISLARARELAAERLAALDAKIAELEAARMSLRRLARECGASEEGPCPIIAAFEGEGG